MEDFSNTLAQLQTKASNCSKSDRLLALEYLKNLIHNLEQIDKDSDEESNNKPGDEFANIGQSADQSNDNRSLTPLKLTIRKFNRNDAIFSCQECSKKYIIVSKMIAHVLNAHSKAEVTCIVCKGTFHSYSLLKVHECFCDKQTVFIRRLCGICGTLCLQIQDYQLHMKEAHMIELEKKFKLFGCHHCDSTFKWRSQLLIHITRRHKDMINKDKAAKRIRYKLLKKTVPSVKNTEPNELLRNLSMKHSCVICKRNFISQRALERHFLSYVHRTRTGELALLKKFVCDICNTSFFKLNCLQRHKTSHQGDLPHKCCLCDYRTSEKCNLTEHMRRHYQIRNFVCEFCDASFVAKRELKDHVAFKHNNNRPYACPDCGKMFKTKRILTRHSKIHSNFRPYVCACGSNFLRMTNLRRHIIGVHRDLNPSIVKVQVPVDKSDIDDNDTKSVWFADSKSIKTKKITVLSLVHNKLPEKVTKKKIVKMQKINNKVTKPKDVSKEIPVQPKVENSPNQMLSINFMIKVLDEEDKDPKLYSNVNQDFLYQSDNSDKYMQSSNSPTCMPVINGIISNKSSLQDTSAIDDSMNICDLVASPSYPLLEAPDQSDDAQIPSKMSFDSISMKNEALNKYKVESIMMESDSRSTLEGIWRPIDTGEDEQNIIDDHTSALVSNSIDMFPPNSGLISSFNEVFLSSVSNNCYTDDPVHWNSGGLSLGNNSAFSGDNGNFIITGTMSACESDPMPVSDSVHTPTDGFLYYASQSQQLGDHNGHQSFAYIESFSSAINLDHNYGAFNDNISFCTGGSNPTFHQTLNSSHMQDLFPISYSSSSHTADFISSTTNHNMSLPPNMLFNPDQSSFFSTNSTSANMTNSSQPPSWIHGQPSPANEYTPESLPQNLLDSYKLSSSQIGMSSSSSLSLSRPMFSSTSNPPRILSPIDFLVAESGYSSGTKHEFCLSMHEIPTNNDLSVSMAENPLISDFCSQSHQYQHSSGHLCSKNFSVVNLISSGCASHNSTKDNDDMELLYS